MAVQRVAVPRCHGGVLGWLDEEPRAPDEQIRTEQVFDRIENRRVMRKIAHPLQIQVRLTTPFGVERPAIGCQQLVEAPTIVS